MPASTDDPLFSRRTALTVALAAPLLPAAAGAAGSPLPEIIRRTEEQMRRWMTGDMQGWAALIKFDDAFTLMQPFGGPVSHGFDGSPAHLADLARRFRNGGGHLEVVQSLVTPDMVVLVMIEHQHGEVGGLPDQDWSLRVTQIYRRHGSEWRLAHRHADPLVRSLGLEQTAALARDA